MVTDCKARGCGYKYRFEANIFVIKTNVYTRAIDVIFISVCIYMSMCICCLMTMS